VSLVTTCPACGTRFRVTPGQLAVHRGDVRCGQCHHVFNALTQLAELPTAPDASKIDHPTFREEVSADHDGSATSTPTPTEDVASSHPVRDQQLERPASVERPLEDTTPCVPPSHEDTAIDTMNLDIVLEPPDTQEAEASSEPIFAPPAPEEASVHVPPPHPSVLEHSKQVHRLLADPPRRSTSSWLLAVFALLLSLGLVLQTAYFLRTEIAARFPPAKPWLMQGCQWMGCTVGLPRQIDLLTIEDSGLEDDADHDGVLVLTYVLRNRAAYAQDYPVLELTLTDTFDQPVLRRTFRPQEYLPPGTDVTAGIAADDEVSGRLHLKVEGDKPAGYRLWLKY
jgi:predicted Zn finger-like uncharacterized protein